MSSVKALKPASARKGRAGAETRKRILDSTVALLVEAGYSRTSTWDVCARAGVSRGALLHHFPTRVSLFVAAASHLAEAPLDQLDAALARTAPDGQPLLFLDWLWRTLDGDLFTVGLELLTAARTEPELQGAIRQGGDHLQQRLEDTIASIAQSNGLAPDAPLATALRLSIPAIRGIGLDLAVGGDRKAHRKLYIKWREQIADHLGAGN